MFRLALPLALLPSVAAAEWVPRPAMFNYDAVFDVCTTNPSAPDLAAACTATLSAAYALKRATAVATAQCFPDDLATCPTPFEDQGLPAIAMRIAVDVGCEASDLTVFDGPLPPDHCAAIASDIMIDEGVVPLFTDITCGPDWSECSDLIVIQAGLWEDAIFDLARDDALIVDLIDRTEAECAQNLEGSEFQTTYLSGVQCITEGFSILWADLALQNEQAN